MKRSILFINNKATSAKIPYQREPEPVLGISLYVVCTCSIHIRYIHVLRPLRQQIHQGNPFTSRFSLFYWLLHPPCCLAAYLKYLLFVICTLYGGHDAASISEASSRRIDVCAVCDGCVCVCVRVLHTYICQQYRYYRMATNILPGTPQYSVVYAPYIQIYHIRDREKKKGT